MDEPTVKDFIDAARFAIRGTVDKTADFILGSDYEAIAGSNGILWSRETQRDTDLFRAIRFVDAEGEDLTDAAKKRFNIDRVMPSRGRGTATLQRPTAAAGAGPVWKGTRFRVATGSFSESKTYRVTEDTPVGATALLVEVPVEAVETGKGWASDGSSTRISIDDPLWDTTLYVSRLVCEEGTELESPGVFRNRVATERFSRRVGHATAIIAACKAAGAGQVAVFRSDYGGDALDAGLNVVYVGDLGYTGNADLVRVCTAALRSVRVGGDCMQVLPMARVTAKVDADVYLNDSPALLPIDRLEHVHRAAILQHLGGADGGFTFSRTGIQGALTLHTVEVQEVDFVEPSADTTILVSGNFPPVLNRYVVADADIILRYHPPK